MTVRSTKDLGWAIALNSKDKYTDSGNFVVLLVKQDVASLFQQQGVPNLEQHFPRGTEIEVRGLVEPHPDKRSGKQFLQIKVKTVEQIRIR